jgi:hypothetical protein
MTKILNTANANLVGPGTLLIHHEKDGRRITQYAYRALGNVEVLSGREWEWERPQYTYTYIYIYIYMKKFDHKPLKSIFG